MSETSSTLYPVFLISVDKTFYYTLFIGSVGKKYSFFLGVQHVWFKHYWCYQLGLESLDSHQKHYSPSKDLKYGSLLCIKTKIDCGSS